MKGLNPDQIAKFERLQAAIAEQEPVRAKAIKAFNAAVQVALLELHDAAGPFFGHYRKRHAGCRRAGRGSGPR